MISISRMGFSCSLRNGYSTILFSKSFIIMLAKTGASSDLILTTVLILWQITLSIVISVLLLFLSVCLVDIKNDIYCFEAAHVQMVTPSERFLRCASYTFSDIKRKFLGLKNFLIIRVNDSASYCLTSKWVGRVVSMKDLNVGVLLLHY